MLREEASEEAYTIPHVLPTDNKDLPLLPELWTEKLMLVCPNALFTKETVGMSIAQNSPCWAFSKHIWNFDGVVMIRVSHQIGLPPDFTLIGHVLTTALPPVPISTLVVPPNVLDSPDKSAKSHDGMEEDIASTLTPGGELAGNADTMTTQPLSQAAHS